MLAILTRMWQHLGCTIDFNNSLFETNSSWSHQLFEANLLFGINFSKNLGLLSFAKMGGGMLLKETS